MKSTLSIPTGGIFAVFIFLWTVEARVWSHLDWLSGGLLGLALIGLFLFGNIVSTHESSD